MAAETSDQLAWALKALRDAKRQAQYRTTRRYYDGLHELAFATEKFRTVFGGQLRAYADNLCPAVVDSISDRLKVTGVNAGEGEGAAQLATKAWEIWQRNRMDVRAPETHHESLLTGDGYALVWPDKAGEAVIWSIPSCDIAVSYDPNRPGVIRRAARVWQDDDDGRVHVDLYLVDEVQRFVTRGARRSATLSGSTTPKDFLPFVYEGDLEGDGTQPNPWGRVPIVHFPNLRYHAYGSSELTHVIPLQNALNKTGCDMLVAMEFSAFRQRWATGVDAGDTDVNGEPLKPPWEYGVDRMLSSEDPESRFGNFDSTDLSQFVAVQENLRSEIARVSGTPLHYLFITRGDFPSGEAMKSAEARFTRKVENRQAAFGNQWEDLLALALRMEDEPKATGEMLSLEWEPASPIDLPAGPSGAQPTPVEPPAAAV